MESVQYDAAQTVPPDAKRGLAAALLSDALPQSATQSIDGERVSLREMVAQAPVATAATTIVNAYWELSQSLAEYHFALDETQFVQGLAPPQIEHQRALLEAQQAAAEARSALARMHVLRAQQALAEAAQMGGGTRLPLPADKPFVGPYRTHFKVLNERGAAPDRLGSIDRALPVMRELIGAQAEAVAASHRALDAMRTAYQQDQLALADVLNLYHDLRSQRRDFLLTVTDYNQQIARYASSVSLPSAGADQLVRMLIETPGGERSVLSSKRSESEIRRVSNEEPVDGWSDASKRER